MSSPVRTLPVRPAVRGTRPSWRVLLGPTAVVVAAVPLLGPATTVVPAAVLGWGLLLVAGWTGTGSEDPSAGLRATALTLLSVLALLLLGLPRIGDGRHDLLVIALAVAGGVGVVALGGPRARRSLTRATLVPVAVTAVAAGLLALATTDGPAGSAGWTTAGTALAAASTGEVLRGWWLAGRPVAGLAGLGTVAVQGLLVAGTLGQAPGVAVTALGVGSLLVRRWAR